MAQPIKEDKNITKKGNKTKKQPKKVIDERIPPKKNVPVKGAWKKNKKHEEYGTSKLEEKFAKEFLDKLGVEYIYQFKAESIGRYYDFCIPSANLIIIVIPALINFGKLFVIAIINLSIITGILSIKSGKSVCAFNKYAAGKTSV